MPAFYTHDDASINDDRFEYVERVYAAINAAAGARTPTGVRKALARVGDQIADFTEKFFQAIQDRLDGK